MNIHHLELFYYVAKHKGIAEAARNMPYGIQQPAISGQIIQLEEFIGTNLFHRRPFALTPTGKELFAFIEPFFGNLANVTRKLRKDTVRSIRIAAPELVLCDYLPSMAKEVRKTFPSLRLHLRVGSMPQMQKWLEEQEIDLAFAPVETELPATFSTLLLRRIPLQLVVLRKSRFKSAEQFWSMDRIDEPLIALPPFEPICRHFQEGLTRKKVDWFPSIEVSSLKLIETYVLKGYGIGLLPDMPGVKLSSQLRALPLRDFEPLTFGSIWRGKPSPEVKTFLDIARHYARDAHNE